MLTKKSKINLILKMNYDIEEYESHTMTSTVQISQHVSYENLLEFEIPNSRVRNSNRRIMAATSDEQMRLLLSSFDQIYEVKFLDALFRSLVHRLEYSVFFLWLDSIAISWSEIQSRFLSNRLKLESRNQDLLIA